MTPTIKRFAGLAAAALLVAAPLAADAQSYRCVGADGKRHYGSTVPPQCTGRPVEELSAQGIVVRRIDPEGSEKERRAKEAFEAKKRDEDVAAKETARRNRALLATYTSEKDIDEARARALADNQKVVKEAEARIEGIRKRQAGYEKELEFFKGKNKPPARLTEDIKNAEDELKLAQDALVAKKKEVESINAKYDEDKKRYAEATKKR